MFTCPCGDARGCGEPLGGKALPVWTEDANKVKDQVEESYLS